MTAPPAHGGRAHAGSLVLIFLLGALLYAHVLTGPFLYDDVTEILANPRVHRLSAIPGLIAGEFWRDTPGWPSLHRPVTAATIPLLFILGEGASWPFHLANMILHGLVSCLLAAIVMRLTARTIPAVVAGVLFAAHPIHTEAVAWVSGRSELLYAAAGLCAWWLHLRAREGSSPGYADRCAGLRPANQTCGPEARVPRLLWTAAAALLLAVSLGSKETAICWPFIFLAGDFLFPPVDSARGRRFRWHHAVYFAVVGAWLLWRYGVLGHLGRRPFAGIALSNPLVDLPWWPAWPLTSLRLTLMAATKGVWPGTACIDYGYDQIPIARSPLHLDVVFAATAVVALLTWGALIVLRRREGASTGRLLLLGVGVSLLSWLPVSSLVAPSIVIFAERTLYLPVFGWCLAAGVAAESLWRAFPARRRALVATGIALATVPAALTLARGALFLDPLAVFSASAKSCERSANAHVLRAGALEEAGRDEDAAAALLRALAIAPHHADARAALATTLARMGRTEDATREIAAALEDRTLPLETKLAGVEALHAVGKSREAGELLAALVAEHPDDDRVLFTQGRVLLALGQMPEALEVFERLGRLHPESPYGLDGAGTALVMLRRDAEAETAFRGALGLDPYDTNALFNLGLLKLGGGLDGRPDGGDGAGEAAGLLSRYLRLMPSDARGWAHLARAQESAGDLRGSRDALQRAVDRAPGNETVRRALDEFLLRHPELTESARD